MKKALLVLVVLALLGGFASAKKMAILNFNKGEMTDDNNATTVSLSEENAEKEGDFTLKLEFTGKTKDSAPWAAVFQPKKAAWAAFTKVKMVIVNPSDKDIKFGWMIKGAKGSNGPDNRKDWEMVLKPGKNEKEFSIVGQKCNDGTSPLDCSKVFIWAMWNLEETPITVFIQKLYLEDDNK